MPKVVVKLGDTIEAALRRFKRAVEKAGVLTKVRRCQAYEKPSALRKRKRAAAVKRHLKKMAREAQHMRTQQFQHSFHRGIDKHKLNELINKKPEDRTISSLTAETVVAVAVGE
jgi:small subunit ribosomal protein S21